MKEDRKMCETRISSLLGKITVLFVICCFCLPAQAKYGGGTGEPNDPYLIYDANHMQAIGAYANDWEKCFKLMANIDLSGFTGTSFNIIGYYRHWNDIKPFAGVFDGNGHTISSFTYTSTGTNNIGLFGYFNGPNAEIKNLVLINAEVDAGTGWFVGSLVGFLDGGIVTNCYAEGGSICGKRAVGGLLGMNRGGVVTDCHATCSVSEDYPYDPGGGPPPPPSIGIGGLTGWNAGTITDCYSDGEVYMGAYVGGLCGGNDGTITNSYATGSVVGDKYSVGGLVGVNYHGTIIDCYAIVSVVGDCNRVGGLVGWNGDGYITNCYSTGSVLGSREVGGLVGVNGRCDLWDCYGGTISDCYSAASVMGDNYVGGLVGWSYYGEITDSFWDIETSGQDWSDGGTGKTTAEMQTMSTFTDAGWDFVGETVNGIKDIWFIPQQDYPHLWWEGMQVPMKLTPVSLNCRSEGNWVKAHITLPEGFTVADVNSNRPAVLHSLGFQSLPLYVFVNKNKLVEIEAAFERQAVCSLAGNWPQELTVAGFLADGNIFLGTSNIRIIHPGMKVIEELAWYWLNADCVHPDFCDGIDMNRDSLVNLLDYALLMNINVEFVTDE